jgi:hypothetical protein
VIARHPYRAVGSVLAVFLSTLLVAGMIGQRGDGPWGGLPDWLGTASHATWFVSALVLFALSLYPGVLNVRHRRASR